MSRPSWDKTFMVSTFSAGGAQEMTGFFFENNLMKGKKDNNPIPANNFLLVFIPRWDCFNFFHKKLLNYSANYLFKRPHKIHQVPDFIRIRHFFLKLGISPLPSEVL